MNGQRSGVDYLAINGLSCYILGMCRSVTLGHLVVWIEIL